MNASNVLNKTQETLTTLKGTLRTLDVTVTDALAMTSKTQLALASQVSVVFATFHYAIENLLKAETEPLSTADFVSLQTVCTEFNEFIKGYNLMSAYLAAQTLTRLVLKANVQRMSPAERLAYDAAELEFAAMRK